jgi:hypothetical protein
MVDLKINMVYHALMFDAALDRPDTVESASEVEKDKIGMFSITGQGKLGLVYCLSC